MDGLMMDYELTIPSLVRHAEQYHSKKTIVSRLPDRSLHRTTYGAVLHRARKLAGALETLGVRESDRIATFCWNHSRHLEMYYAVPCMGAVLHTLNLRLHPDDLAYIATHAGDSVVFVDRVLWPLFEKFRDRVPFKHIIVVGDGEAPPSGTLDYETLIASGREHGFDTIKNERAAAAMCYTSGTTGQPKGVIYAHRSMVLHSLGFASTDVDLTRETDTVCAIVPMFHANAWGLPFTSLLVGCNQVLPGPHLDTPSVLDLLVNERVTVGLGVPTIWNGVLQALDKQPGAHDLSRLRVIASGGSAVPESMIRAFDKHGLRMHQVWGMTETSPLGSSARPTSAVLETDADTQYRYRATQGRTVPLVEARVVTENGVAPRDGETMGELEVRGPWIISGYYNAPEAAHRFSDDGWFKTGDIVTMDADGWITIRDRSKDVIKSGGEWISSVALETALLAHASVAEAMVVGLPHPQWDERPLALVVRREGCDCTPDELLAHLAPHFPKWWMPTGFEFVSALPRTSVGKLDKKVMRQEYAGYFTSTPSIPQSASASSATR